MELLKMMQHRRSVRAYTGEVVSEEKIEKILQAGLLAPSGRNRQPWEFIVVRDKEMLKKLSTCRPHGPGMLSGADVAIVVIANPEIQDVWCEDCSIAMSYMHLMADALGLGSCWVQGRLREAPDDRMAEDYVRECLGFPDNYVLEAILSIGVPKEHPDGKRLEDLPVEKIHREKY